MLHVYERVKGEDVTPYVDVIFVCYMCYLCVIYVLLQVYERLNG